MGRLIRTTVLALLILGCVFPLAAFDVDLIAPTIFLKGPYSGIDLGPINTELQIQGEILATTLENDPDIANYTDQPKLSQGFANAGAAAVHLGTQRSFQDYKYLAVVVGSGFAASAPGVDPAVLNTAAADIAAEGDLYIGAAVQPINASIGINLERWINRTRAYVKVGYFNADKGTYLDELGFNSLNFGLGANYQLVESKSLPLGFVRWRGISLASGLFYQRNETIVEIQVADNAFEEPVTFGDVGLDDDFGVPSGTEFGVLTVAPSLDAVITSDTFSVPLEVNTGLRILWLLNLNAGVGADIVFGSSEVALGADAVTGFVPSPAAAPYVDVNDGSAGFKISTTQAPQLIRPRVTAGLGLNLGPVKVDIPAMFYFDAEGNSLMAGVNVGFVW